MIKTVQELIDHLVAAKKKRKGIVGISADKPIYQAAQLMTDEKINLLAVVNYAGRYIGVISTNDTSAALAKGNISQVVRDIRTANVVTVFLDNDIMDLPKQLSLNHIRHLVVTDNDGNWVAILDTNEILSAIMANIAEEENQEAQQKAEYRRLD